MSKLERAVAKDEHGVFVAFDVIVKRRLILAVSCSCWNHRLPFRIEVIESLAASYFRRADTDEDFREIGHAGPITIEVESAVRESY